MSTVLSTTGFLNAVDSVTGSVALKKPLSGSYTGSAFAETSTVTISTTPVVLGLPTTTINYLYIRNLTPSTNTLTVTWTPTGGSSNTVIVLPPQGFIHYNLATTGGGVTAVTITGSASSTIVEYLLGG